MQAPRPFLPLDVLDTAHKKNTPIAYYTAHYLHKFTLKDQIFVHNLPRKFATSIKEIFPSEDATRSIQKNTQQLIMSIPLSFYNMFAEIAVFENDLITSSMNCYLDPNMQHTIPLWLLTEEDTGQLNKNIRAITLHNETEMDKRPMIVITFIKDRVAYSKRKAEDDGGNVHKHVRRM